jgi:transposase InsO family protein
MISTLYSQAKIAEILGISRQALAKKMIDCRETKVGDRGLRLYSLDALPENISDRLRISQSKSETLTESHPTAKPELEQLPAALEQLVPESITAPLAKPRQIKPLPVSDQKKMDLLDAWREIMAIQEQWCQDKGWTQQREKDEQFSAAVKRGEVPEVAEYLPVVAWGSKPGISRGSLQRYRDRFSSHGLAGYIRNTAKTNQSPIEKDLKLKQAIINHLISFPAAQLTRLHKEVRKLHPECPRLTAFRRWVRNWMVENESFYLHETDRDKWNNTYLTAYGTHNDTTAPNQIWELDSTPADLALPDGRHCALGLIDVYTRRALVLANKSSTAAAVLSILRQAIISWGLPDAIRTDNGSDYISHAVKRFCSQMRIEHLICTPGTPQAKPYIERFFGTLSHDVMPMLPGYLGHNVATVTKLRGGQKGEAIKAAMDAGMFQGWLDHWLEKEYHPRIHGTLKKSPNDALLESISQGWQPREVASIRELDMLLLMVGKKKCQKAGIRHDNHFYIADDLPANKYVWVALDAVELGRIYWFHENNVYGGEAIAAELMGIDRREIALRAKQKQKAAIRASKAETKKLKGSVEPFRKDVIAEISQTSIEPAEVALPPNVVSINKSKTKTESSSGEGSESLFKGLAVAYLSNTLAEVVYQVEADRLGNISARGKSQQEFIFWSLRPLGINQENREDFFAEAVRLADERIASLTQIAT